MKAVAAVLAGLAFAAAAAEPQWTDLPPSPMVERVLRAAPAVQAADSLVRAEEAHRARLEAGSHEWLLRMGGQRRRVTGDTRYREAELALERPLRLPAKAALDAELGAAGVDIAHTGRGDAAHEAARALLKAWFAWLKEGESARLWEEQAGLLSRHAQAVRRRQQLGDAARVEAVAAEAALAQAEAQLAAARARERSAAADLGQRYPGLALPARLAISSPPPLEGGEGEWIAAVADHSHELALARGESRRARLAASRSARDTVPDPTVGFHVARERSGEENIVGFSIAIPLPGSARRAASAAAEAEAEAAVSREAGTQQKVAAEAAGLYHGAVAARAAWDKSREAAERLGQAADMTARAYQLGEGSLADLLSARRLANDARLSARQQQLEALELRYRLLVDAHRLWDFD